MSGISVRNMMKIGGLKDCRIIAGHRNVDRKVKYVTILEVPEIVKWLKGSELLLTSLYSIKEDPILLTDLIRLLHEKGTSAIAIKPYHTMDRIPRVIIEEAEKYGFPVIQIPEHVTYLDILAPVMHAIFNDKIIVQEDIEKANQLLNEVALSDQGIGRFVETLKNLTQNIITVESEYSYIDLPAAPFSFEPLARDKKAELEFFKRPLRMKRKRKDEHGEMREIDCIVAPILIEGELCGNITSWRETMDHLEIDLAILEKASTLLALEFLRKKVRFDVEQQYKNEFFHNLIYNRQMSVQEIEERGKRYGFSSSHPYICLLIEASVMDGENEEHLLSNRVNQVENIVRFMGENVLVGSLSGNIVVFLPIGSQDEERIRKRIEELYRRLSSVSNPSFSSSMGVGRFYPGIPGIRKSFKEAEQALKMSKRIKRDVPIVHYGDLGIYRLFGDLQGTKELTSLYEESVGRLVKYDSGSDLELVKTLRTYFDCNERLKDTANALFIHVNTLKYRLSKIEKLTGYSLNQSEGKFILHLGLKVYDFLQNDEKMQHP